MKLICTIGDCNGIGLEIFYKAVCKLTDSGLISFSITICGNIKTITEYFAKIGLPFHQQNTVLFINKFQIQILECTLYSEVQFGINTNSSALLAVESLEKAISSTLSGEYDALVTLPISKSSLNQIGWNYPGQTEMLAHRCNNVQNPMMVLCTDTIRVALATIHVPIVDIPSKITRSHIIERINCFHYSLLTDFMLSNPSIAVLGLNPHAGEYGEIGSEEIDIINPAIEESIQNGMFTKGTFPADGFFAHGEYKNYDGILAMYHDQGLIPLKLLATDGGVNFTAGLPIVRTSPDHGTAYGIAGKGIADERSTVSAFLLASHIANNRLK